MAKRLAKLEGERAQLIKALEGSDHRERDHVRWDHSGLSGRNVADSQTRSSDPDVARLDGCQWRCIRSACCAETNHGHAVLCGEEIVSR